MFVSEFCYLTSFHVTFRRSQVTEPKVFIDCFQAVFLVLASTVFTKGAPLPQDDASLEEDAETFDYANEVSSFTFISFYLELFLVRMKSVLDKRKMMMVRIMVVVAVF